MIIITNSQWSGFTGVVNFSVSSNCCNRNSSVVALDQVSYFRTRTLQQLTLGHQLANIASCNIDLGGFYCSTATYCTATGENLIGKIRNVETEKICKSLCRSSKVQNQ